MVYPARCRCSDCGNRRETRPRLSDDRREEEEGIANSACSPQPRRVGGDSARQAFGMVHFGCCFQTTAALQSKDSLIAVHLEGCACRRQSRYLAALVSFSSA